MRKMIKSVFVIFLGFVALVCIACEKKDLMTKEKISLAKTVLNEVEFENSEKVKLNQQDNKWIVSGEIESMLVAQKSSFGVDGVTHIVVLKFEFDNERTIDYFKIDGENVKVFSTEKNVEGYVGSISELLDNEPGEDAFCYLVLSANTKEYDLISRYTDGTESVVSLKIEATLSSANAE